MKRDTAALDEVTILGGHVYGPDWEPLPATTCECGARLVTPAELAGERCEKCANSARARWDAAVARRQAASQ